MRSMPYAFPGHSMRTLREILGALPTTAETGLDAGAVAESRRRFGANRLTPLPRVPPHHPSVEGLAVMVAVILATGVAFLSEYRSDREFEVLNAQKESLRAKVIRGGQFHTVVLEEVVVGDVVSLEMGDEVPADGRLLKSADLYVDQSLMTGESE